jgi:hypothetical protein
MTEIPASPTPAPAAYNPTRIGNYYDQVHKASWGRRAAGLFAGATLGLAIGAGVGLIAAFLPYALTQFGFGGVELVQGGFTALGSVTNLPSFSSILSCIGIYGGAAAFMAGAVATDVGASAGAMAGGLAVREHQETQANAQQPVIAAQPTKDAGPSGPKYFSWKAGGTLAALCGGFGAMVAATGAPFVQSGLALLLPIGVSLSGPAAIVASAVMFAVFGACFGIKAGRLTNQLSNFYTKILTDDFWKKKEPVQEAALPLPQQEKIGPAPSLPSQEPQHEAAPERKFAVQPKSLTPEAVLAERASSQEQMLMPGR